VKMWGKSPRVGAAMYGQDKPCGLKCHVYPDPLTGGTAYPAGLQQCMSEGVGSSDK